MTRRRARRERIAQNKLRRALAHSLPLALRKQVSPFVDKRGEPISYLTRMARTQDHRYCRIKLTAVGDVMISTVWTGQPFRPFETWAYDGNGGLFDPLGATTEGDAVFCHDAAVSAARKGLLS